MTSTTSTIRYDVLAPEKYASPGCIERKPISPLGGNRNAKETIFWSRLRPPSIDADPPWITISGYVT